MKNKRFLIYLFDLKEEKDSLTTADLNDQDGRRHRGDLHPSLRATAPPASFTAAAPSFCGTFVFCCFFDRRCVKSSVSARNVGGLQGPSLIPLALGLLIL